MRLNVRSFAVPIIHHLGLPLERIQLGTLLIPAMAILGFLSLSAWAWPYTMDDAFISFRYAKHIGDGLGPIWNLADRASPVEGFTSFLHVWTLGFVRFLTNADVVLTGKVLGVMSGVTLAVAIALEARRYRLGLLATAVTFSALVLPFAALNAVSGLETTFFMLWGFLATVACIRAADGPSPRITWLYVLFGLLATLTRPEFVLPFLGMAVYLWWKRPETRSSLATAFLVAYVLPGLIIVAWRFSFYGDIVPQPFHVKQQTDINRWGIVEVGRFVGFVAMPYLLLAAAACRLLWNNHRNLLIIVGLYVGVTCLYFTTTLPLMGWWYRFLIPLTPLLALLAGVSIQSTNDQLGQHPIIPSRVLFTLTLVLLTIAMVAGIAVIASSSYSWFSPILPLIPLLVLAGLVLLRTGERPLQLSPRVIQGMVVGLIAVFSLAHVPLIVWFLPGHYGSEIRFRELGQRMRPFAADDRWMVYKDVGVIVYESEWNTIDVVGLNTSRDRVKSSCLMKHDVVLQFSWSEAEAPNPCQEDTKLYLTLADLPMGTGAAISRDKGYAQSYMRVYVRNDVSYAGALKTSLLQDWPEKYSRPSSWLEGYWERYRWMLTGI